MALANHKKLDEKHGINLKIKDYKDPQLIVRDFAWGNLPIAQLTTVEVVDLCSRLPKRCPVIALILNESRGGDQIVAREPIGDIQSLKGKAVGVNPTTLGPYVLIRSLQKNNLQISDVRIITLGMEDMPDALKDGRVDAIAAYPPFSEEAKLESRGKTVFDSSQIPEEIFDVLAVSPDFFQQNQPLIASVISSWAAAHQFARKHPNEAMRFIAKRQGVTPGEMRRINQGLVYFDLEKQEKMLSQGGSLENNITNIRQGQIKMGLMSNTGSLPRTTNKAISAALTMRQAS